jgi:signal transduction histidine kinase
VQQALTNLVVNALQASSSGDEVNITLGREHTIDPDTRAPRDVIAIAVRDRGEGIAPEHVPHVFEPFFSTKDVGEGTGLGLSVAYGIVREHAGWIDVSSRVGVGCVFTMYIPDAQETSE